MPLAQADHGGAWNIPDAAVDDSRKAIREALAQGRHALRSGKSDLDVVELAVRALEDDPTFDRGRGSRLAIEREVGMDASIMDGRDLTPRLARGLATVDEGMRVAVNRTEST